MQETKQSVLKYVHVESDMYTGASIFGIKKKIKIRDLLKITLVLPQLNIMALFIFLV